MSTITIPRPGPAVLTNPVNVSLVRTRADLDAFVDLPFRLYAGDRSWVPPLRADQRKQLDPARNPYFAHAEAGLFLARRGGRVVGRISAHTDEQYNAFHSVDGQVDSTGFFGFFECEDDPEATQALLEAAAGWLAQEGKATMVGPASFTLNDVAGLLIDGFGAPPIILMTYNPPYYEGLLAGAGLEKVQDLYAYQLETSIEPPADIVEFARSAEEKFTFRPMDMRRFDEELVRFLGVYNQAWERNWGFCPLTEEEIRHHAKDLKPIIDPNLVIIAEQDGEPVAAGLTLPDVNQVLVRSRGRLGPVTLARLLYRAKRRRWDVCRVFALGVKKGYRETGIGAHLYLDTLRAAQRGGYRWGEMSWILESNDAMNRAIRHMGGRVYKTYRMYGRSTV